MDLIPVTLMTGFLGSGKTTVLNRLVLQPEMADALVLINEFGEIGLDHLLVAHSREDIVVEMSSGCLCCTIRGDLVRTLTDLCGRTLSGDTKQFSRVVIETTGLADPAPIVHTLVTHPALRDRFRLDAIVTAIDARNGELTLDTHAEAIKQAAMADILLVTKSDLAEVNDLAGLASRLHTMNPAAEVIRVSHGELVASRILDLRLFTTDGKIADVEHWLAAERYPHYETHGSGHRTQHRNGDPHEHKNAHILRHDHDHSHDINRHDDQIRAFCFTVDEPIPQDVVTEWLEVLVSLMGPSMLRIKGILNLQGQDQPIVIHGVQHIFHPLVMLDAWPSDDKRSRIVFITRSIARETIERTFKIFSAVTAVGARASASNG
ncbi:MULTISPECIES: GTP-binding protein [unclassified Caballeronia]|uniref:CobW family GTP-binding protein n=1 Tax=unclassified Caballeronia TaxID=2646786 RepID=UPI00286709F7|nr:MULTISPECIES: GTP-binding protein [unclassified Caballeronia]MDR5777403.1 GTP-binding protein [Caballeronia sp. LZ002]MDR5852853.1 GTP-binding protein [Caballeronia sp. LZ003]